MGKSNPLDKVGKVMVYVDSIYVWFGSRRVTQKHIRELGALCGSVRVHHSPEARSPVYVDQLILHQPSIEAVEYVDRIADRHHLVEADVAFDFFPRPGGTIQQLDAALRPCIRQRFSRSGSYRVENTTYTNDFDDHRKLKKSRFRTYADKPSKINGLPTFHHEWCAVGKRALNRIGLSSRVGSLRFFDPAQAAQKLVMFDQVRYLHLARALTKTPKSELNDERIRRFARYLKYRCPDAQSVLKRYRHHPLVSTKQVVKRLRVPYKVIGCNLSHFLPSPKTQCTNSQACPEFSGPLVSSH